MKLTKTSGASIAMTAAALIVSGAALIATANAETFKGRCFGVNGCADTHYGGSGLYNGRPAAPYTSMVRKDDGSIRMLAPEHPSTRYRLFMADTFDRLRSGERPTVSLEDYLAAMEVIDAAYEKAMA